MLQRSTLFKVALVVTHNFYCRNNRVPPTTTPQKKRVKKSYTKSFVCDFFFHTGEKIWHKKIVENFWIFVSFNGNVDPMPCRPTWMAGFFLSETVKGKEQRERKKRRKAGNLRNLHAISTQKNKKEGGTPRYIYMCTIFSLLLVWRTHVCPAAHERKEKKGQCCVVLCWLCMKDEEE